jgi:excisionase family DNA binding protein
VTEAEIRNALRAELDGHVEPRLLSPAKAGRALGISESAVYRLIREDQLRSFKVGRRRLIPTVALDEYVAAQCAQQGVA